MIHVTWATQLLVDFYLLCKFLLLIRGNGVQRSPAYLRLNHTVEQKRIFWCFSHILSWPQQQSSPNFISHDPFSSLQLAVKFWESKTTRFSIHPYGLSRNYFVYLKTLLSGLPWWRSGWESACQCRAHGFESWSGKIPHATEQLGPWATITEPARLEPVLHNKRGRDSERPAHRDEKWPPLATTRESPRTETKTQHSHK